MRAKAAMSPPRPERKCALCGKPQSAAFKPFCSKRCADVDLAKWLGGRYAIAGEERADDGRAPPEANEE